MLYEKELTEMILSCAYKVHAGYRADLIVEKKVVTQIFRTSDSVKLSAKLCETQCLKYISYTNSAYSVR
jgi:hypothetical protein